MKDLTRANMVAKRCSYLGQVFGHNVGHYSYTKQKPNDFFTTNHGKKVDILGRFPIGIKTEIRYLILSGSHNFMR